MLERHLAQIEALEKKGIQVRSNATASYSHASQAVWVNMWSFTLYYVRMGYLFSSSLRMLN